MSPGRVSLLLALAPCGAVLAADESARCERRWTFPVPFHQSVAWSPGGERLAFSAVTTSWDDGYTIFLVDRDGTDLERFDTGGRAALYPVFSPDGGRLAFTARTDGNSDVWVASLDGTGMTRLTEDPAGDGYPTWSPDGGAIAFHSDRDGDYEIYVMSADGSSPRRLTDHPADDYNPAWSPDGAWIAFDSDRDEVEGDEIYIVRPDGSDLARVVDAGVFPTWSPDGERILFALDDLYSVGVDGSGRARLVADAVSGAWSPDGSEIAVTAIDYDADCVDHHTLVLVDAAGGSRRELHP